MLNLHDEKIIGYKALSGAEMGCLDSSNQTHIGLFKDVLTYLKMDNETIEDDAMFIYNGNIKYLPLNINKIKNPDGTYRSPKLIKGGKSSLSVCTEIWHCVRENTDAAWYIVWFGLDNGQAVFMLFNSESQVYTDFLFQIGINLNKKQRGRIKEDDHKFDKLVKYFNNIIYRNEQKNVKNMEIDIQILNERELKRKYTNSDIGNAVNEYNNAHSVALNYVGGYLEKIKQKKEIKSFTRFDKNEQNSFLYDFEVVDLKDEINYVSVKATGFSFDQKIPFSQAEAEFAQKHSKNYAVYRVYNISKNSAKLKICNSPSACFAKLQKNLQKFSQNIWQDNIELQSAYFSIHPGVNSLNFKKEISLPVE